MPVVSRAACRRLLLALGVSLAGIAPALAQAPTPAPAIAPASLVEAGKLTYGVAATPVFNPRVGYTYAFAAGLVSATSCATASALGPTR